MMKNKTGLVALIVLAVATLLMVFLVLPNMNKDKPVETPVAKLAETPAGGGETTTADGKQARSTTEAGDTAAATGEQPAASTEATATQETASAETTPADATAGWVTPAFDLLRVEPDGSTVIAGRGQPNTKLEIKNGETVVATADIGPTGDFAAVFDQPLAAGDYQLTLNVKDDKGGSKISEEVATVSVPKDASGELLAMVSKPGEASRLITVPETKEKAAAETTAEKTIEQPAVEPAAATETAKATDTGTAATGEQPAATETAQATAEGTSALGEATTTSAASGVGYGGGNLLARVSAVELEGDHMFVAGTAKPGALVRLYADDKLVGEAKADEQGRYVADGKMDLTVGRHTIRADVMSADGSKVEFRASVPFDRPEGEQIAVVAQETGTGGAGPALGLIGGGTFDKLRGEAEKAVALLKGLYANGRLPSVEELAAARSATEIALKSLAEFKPGAEEGEAAREMAEKASKAAASALATLQALPSDATAVGAALGSVESAVAGALAPAIEKAAAVVETATAAADSSIEALAGQATALQQQFVALFSDGRNATTAEIQTARTGLEGALKAITGFTAPAGAATDVQAAIDKLKGWAATALERFAAVPAGAGKEAYQQALASLEGMPSLQAPATAETASGTAQTGTADSGQAVAGTDTGGGAPATSETASGDGQTVTGNGVSMDGATAGASTGEAAAGEPETVEQAPLQASKTSVIIRRGDTLWQISRRIYGKGVRYTTIYLANEDQITDPDRIIPGQVFGVPDKAAETDEQAEEMHRKHVRGN
ncbi:LysM peptidoglycan-binding domain-containing protein [Shinella curvata]|uniref:LysM peptidoglycan-binding domain-containing protein n=1 Tax=Shinella curvata TaxID=1817964 RepID=A0ABT8XGJ1_9HYPH|nr:LysM peptidoglycan-binding domain-containing protein [Shinella curvata]MCJ8053483.1 LysM peptidoglycan-binding domain-containing protein [Shinella curvata]MDO6122815.1 LysM peptidoglycan-binding domain-containing protein [Shinella curvata]